MKAVVAAAIEQTRADADEAAIAVTAEFAGVLAMDGDPQAVGRALANLLQNAIRYASSRVTISARGAHSHVIVSVDDDRLVLFRLRYP